MTPSRYTGALACWMFRFQSSSAGPLNLSARVRRAAICSGVIGLNCCAIRTSSSSCPMVVHPNARNGSAGSTHRTGNP